VRHASIATLLLLAAVLVLGLPALAKPPGGVPPGQAKKGNGGGVTLGVTIGGGSAGSVTKHKGGPPPWAPAHGRRAKYKYRYWPDRQVYFDAGRGLYFWIDAGYWKVGVHLPADLNLAGASLSLEMDVAKPYKWQREVAKRYPPGWKKP
jgi:hypothetical protein